MNADLILAPSLAFFLFLLLVSSCSLSAAVDVVVVVHPFRLRLQHYDAGLVRRQPEIHSTIFGQKFRFWPTRRQTNVRPPTRPTTFFLNLPLVLLTHLSIHTRPICLQLEPVSPNR